MNEKIKELKKQAMVETVEHYCWGDPAITRHLDDEKFAELIILECCRKMEDTDIFYGEWMSNVIKEHFGIE